MRDVLVRPLVPSTGHMPHMRSAGPHSGQVWHMVMVVLRCSRADAIFRTARFGEFTQCTIRIGFEPHCLSGQERALGTLPGPGVAHNTALHWQSTGFLGHT